MAKAMPFHCLQLPPLSSNPHELPVLVPLLPPLVRLPCSPGPGLEVNLSRGRSKTTARKTPAPAPAPATAAVPSSSAAVPRTALNVPMPDLHSMAIAIRDGAARIAILEARVREQDGKIDTLQCLHESLRRQVVNRHPSFPLPDSPANATMLLDQSVPPPSMSPLPSALPNLINLDMGVMEPTPLKVEDASDMVGLVFEPSQVQPEGPQLSGEIVILDDPCYELGWFSCHRLRREPRPRMMSMASRFSFKQEGKFDDTGLDTSKAGSKVRYSESWHL
ncbi:hypothetical protein EDD22DRAFT_959710 [Suillus occidentalis]|nr:hypothetical protein EDD22DRAFT_959710 [Suillus occidentalis]